MRVATYVKRDYEGEVLTIKQWEKKGYKPKEGEQPERMWSNHASCGSGKPKKFSFDYYFDYQVEKVN